MSSASVAPVFGSNPVSPTRAPASQRPVLRLEDGLACVPTRPLTLPVTRRRVPFWGDEKGEPLVARSSVSHPTALRPLVAAAVAFVCVFACASFPVAASAAPARVLHVPVDS